jgi:hypothetical protein
MPGSPTWITADFMHQEQKNSAREACWFFRTVIIRIFSFLTYYIDINIRT